MNLCDEPMNLIERHETMTSFIPLFPYWPYCWWKNSCSSRYREYSIFESDIYNIFYVNIHWLFGCLPSTSTRRMVGGNPACWDGHFTFARCCVAPGEDREVAAYVVQTLAKYERVGLYKDYLPGKDCPFGLGIYWCFRCWISEFPSCGSWWNWVREFLDSIAKSLYISESLKVCNLY